MMFVVVLTCQNTPLSDFDDNEDKQEEGDDEVGELDEDGDFDMGPTHVVPSPGRTSSSSSSSSSAKPTNTPPSSQKREKLLR